MDQIEKSKKFKAKSVTHGRKVYALYEDQRDTNAAWVKKANFFYANANILKESLFNSLPKPDVSRMQKGNFLDDASRVAALIIQRGLTYEIKCAESFDEAIKAAILDRLVPGMGQVWLRFEVEENPEAEAVEGDDTGGDEVDVEMQNEQESGPIAGTEKICIEHVFWEDFYYQPARLWSKVTWIARKLNLTEAEIKEKWGEDAMSKVGSVNKKSDDTLTPDEINEDKYTVYEIWDKSTRKVIFHGGGEEPLSETADPYKLKDFYPCPMPLIANVTTNKFLPVTDYHISQDQYEVLNVLYARINLIIEAVKVAGIYDSQSMEIQRMLSGAENRLIPCDNWAMMAETGGVSGHIEWYPVEKIVMVLRELQQQFEAAKSILYEITGMSDILRGASNPYETKGAQQIKAQFASVRMNGYQRDIAIFVRDILRIMSEFMCQLYSVEKLQKIVGQLPPPDMQFAEPALAIIRDDFATMYSVDIQANSLTQADWALEKEQRMEVVQTLGQMLQATVGMAAQAPQIVPLAVQMIKFAIAGYKGASEFEGYVDQILDDMLREQQQAKANPQPKPPSPEEQKAQGEMQKLQMEGQMAQQQFASDQQMAQIEAQMSGEKLQAEMGIKQQEAEMKLQMMQAELAHKEQMYSLEVQIEMLRLKVEEAQAQLAISSQAASNTLDIQHAQQSHDVKMQQAAAKPTGNK